MLFLFANAPEVIAWTGNPYNLRFIGPGVYHENLNPRDGESIYLAPGAVVFGAINIWGVHDVRIFGGGTVVYDGPQDPNHDEGWKHQPNWHGIVMDNARHVEIFGITCIVRSRTWMIQMLDSHNVVFRNVKVIGGCPGNANQDGMDWLGGGDTLVDDCFFRASDDIFALYGNWLGYTQEALTTPGHDVENIVIRHSVLSTSISNVVRASWPQKVFNSRNFRMEDSDVIHMGSGGCKIPFALLEIWDEPSGRGSHVGYRFDNIRLEDWYSLTQLRHPNPEVRDVDLRGVWSLERPELVPSVITGEVHDVARRDTQTSFAYSAKEWKAGEPVAFVAESEARSYEWIFGDGTTATGRSVKHAFPDSDGTLLDGSGRFRVLLKTTGADGSVAWASRSVVIPVRYLESSAPADELLPIQTTGGYTFFVVSNDGGKLEIDGQTVAVSPTPKAQVCGSVGNMAQLVMASIGLKAGKHAIRVTDHHGDGPNNFALYWEGPSMPLRVLPIKPTQ